MKMTMIVILSIFIAVANPFDKFDETGPVITSLTKYVQIEYNGIKKYFEEKHSTIFNWKFCSMASFPMLLGKRCPYFPDHEKYRAIEWRGSTAYIQDNSHVYVGIKYWFSDKDGIPSDTASYQIISYELIESPPYYFWKRDREIILLQTKFDTIFQSIGDL